MFGLNDDCLLVCSSRPLVWFGSGADFQAMAIEENGNPLGRGCGDYAIGRDKGMDVEQMENGG